MRPADAASLNDGIQAAVTHHWGRVIAGDEFSNTGAPDPAKWSVYHGAGHSGNGVRSPAAWTVAHGVATVHGDANGVTGGMTALFAQQRYGRWEVRMRTSRRVSQYHPVLILWPRDNVSPNCAEIDYAEGDADPTTVQFFLHYGCTGSHAQLRVRRVIDMTAWHNYAVQWTAAGIVGYLDGVEWFTDSNPADQPTVPLRQTIQLDWFPNGEPTRAAQLQIAWVRVYR
ncbi:glycoside hydrolase family 16 protein [Rathayibacter soli]|uniref:glycoside hydrolase family 16 protein n=1 Tax=Rathayibacter soli TaxID=3144168 RepID=UPI0027E54312|nr:glycoside hydrolase family 16 protein [Glaciibacter superstes]